MADYVSREVARERLRKNCKAGSIISFLLLLIGLLYGGIAAVLGLNVKLPFDFMYDALNVVVPTMDDTTLAIADCGTKGVLLFLMGLIGMLMFRKISKTGDAFRVRQLKQMKFVAFLGILLGFLPTIVGNGLKVATAVQAGKSPLTDLRFATEPMCIIAVLALFMAIRVLVSGGLLGRQEEQLAASLPGNSSSEPDFLDVPDLSHVPTATPVSDETLASGDYGNFGVHGIDQTSE